MTDDEFMEFVKTARPELQRHVMYKSRFQLSREDVEDVVQEALMRLLRVRYEPHPAPMAWLKTVANNLLRDRWRTMTKDEVVEIDDSFPESKKDDVIIAEDAKAALRAALLRLKTGERDVITHLFLGMTQAEIASHLDMPATTVAHYIREAKAKLKKNRKLAAIYGKGE